MYLTCTEAFTMTQRRDLQALIDAAPVGKMQWRVIICCFLVVMLDG
ncbi:hypothetical protein, partial [Escherichia coli]